MSQNAFVDLAGDVAEGMARRYGGDHEADRQDLARMLRRHHAALSRPLRKRAEYLAEAAVQSGHPLIARQMDLRQARRAHRALMRHLRYKTGVPRPSGKMADMATSLLMAFLVIGGLAVWYLSYSGRL